MDTDSHDHGDMLVQVEYLEMYLETVQQEVVYYHEGRFDDGDSNCSDSDGNSGNRDNGDGHN